jgi:hypothetical protein
MSPGDAAVYVPTTYFVCMYASAELVSRTEPSAEKHAGNGGSVLTCQRKKRHTLPRYTGNVSWLAMSTNEQISQCKSIWVSRLYMVGFKPLGLFRGRSCICIYDHYWSIRYVDEQSCNLGISILATRRKTAPHWKLTTSPWFSACDNVG